MSKNKIDWRSETVWKARLDTLKEKALKDWAPVENPAGGAIMPVLVHNWKVSLSVGGSDVDGEDIWVFSARWPRDGETPEDELAWVKEAIAYLGAPADAEEAVLGDKMLARYWLWRAPGRKTG